MSFIVMESKQEQEGSNFVNNFNDSIVFEPYSKIALKTLYCQRGEKVRIEKGVNDRLVYRIGDTSDLAGLRFIFFSPGVWTWVDIRKYLQKELIDNCIFGALSNNKSLTSDGNKTDGGWLVDTFFRDDGDSGADGATNLLIQNFQTTSKSVDFQKNERIWKEGATTTNTTACYTITAEATSKANGIEYNGVKLVRKTVAQNNDAEKAAGLAYLTRGMWLEPNDVAFGYTTATPTGFKSSFISEFTPTDTEHTYVIGLTAGAGERYNSTNDIGLLVDETPNRMEVGMVATCVRSNLGAALATGIECDFDTTEKTTMTTNWTDDRLQYLEHNGISMNGGILEELWVGMTLTASGGKTATIETFDSINGVFTHDEWSGSGKPASSETISYQVNYHSCEFFQIDYEKGGVIHLGNVEIVADETYLFDIHPDNDECNSFTLTLNTSKTFETSDDELKKNTSHGISNCHFPLLPSVYTTIVDSEVITYTRCDTFLATGNKAIGRNYNTGVRGDGRYITQYKNAKSVQTMTNQNQIEAMFWYSGCPTTQSAWVYNLDDYEFGDFYYSTEGNLHDTLGFKECLEHSYDELGAHSTENPLTQLVKFGDILNKRATLQPLLITLTGLGLRSNMGKNNTTYQILDVAHKLEASEDNSHTALYYEPNNLTYVDLNNPRPLVVNSLGMRLIDKDGIQASYIGKTFASILIKQGNCGCH